MRPYEVVLILDAGAEDAAMEAAVQRGVQLITSRGGTVERIDRWGRRRFAYELKHRTEGYYVVLFARAEPPVMDDLDRTLRLADEVVRHKIVRLPDHVAGRAPRKLGGPEPEAAPAATPA